MQVIVSANYRDRRQKNWLVRKSDESIDNYQLRDRVVIKHFRFCKSYEESGFGCSVVAHGEAEEPVLEIDRSKLVRIEFEGNGFVERNSRVRVESGSVLVLDTTGMYYLPA